MRHVKPDVDWSDIAGDTICNVTPVYCINHFAPKVIKRESCHQFRMTVTAVCVVWFCIGVNRMELAMFLSVSNHLVCSSLKSTLREGLDLNGTRQFLVYNYYVNLMSWTIFGRLKSSRMLWYIKGYEFFDILKQHNCSIFTVMQYK